MTAAVAPAQQFDQLPTLRLPLFGGSSAGVALGDLDGDGDLDMVTANYANCSTPGWCNPFVAFDRLCLNDGRGNLVEAPALAFPGSYGGQFGSFAVKMGDVDGDGDLDVITNGTGSSGARLYRNNGAAQFTRTGLPAGGAQGIAIGDVDGDGDLDLVFAFYASQDRLLINNGSGNFTDETAARMPVDSVISTAVAMGDVDGDGDLDLVIATSQDQNGYYPQSQSRLYLNGGTGTFNNVTASQMPPDLEPTADIALTDVDSDGDLDIVLANAGISLTGWGRQSSLWLNDGAGTFVDATATSMPTDIDWDEAVAVIDIDEDGDPDLVFGSPYTRDRIYHNDGAGTFTDVTTTVLGPAWQSGSAFIEFGDLDGDGDQDLIAGYRLFTNLQRQLDAPAPPQIGQSYTYDIYARHGAPHAFDVALPFVSLAPAAIALPPFGWVGIDPTQAVALPLVTVPPATGVASFALAIPNNPVLAGLSLYAQALHVPYPLPPRLTNVTLGVVQ